MPLYKEKKTLEKIRIGKTRSVLLLCAALLQGLPLASNAADTLNSKSLYMDAVQNEQPLVLEFYPHRTTYTKGEPISFHLKSNHTIYLYLYAQNPDGSSTLILPNHVQTNNQYLANQSVVVPNNNVQFVADGFSQFETIYAVATTSYIDLNLSARPRSGSFTLFPKSAIANQIQLHRKHQSVVQRIDLKIMQPYQDTTTRLSPSDFGIPPGQSTNPTITPGATHLHSLRLQSRTQGTRVTGRLFTLNY